MNHKFLTGALLTSALATVPLMAAEPARAFTWDNNEPGWITLGSEDVAGTSFDVWFYEANVNETPVEGLEAKATFTLEHDFGDPTDSLKFRVDVWNMAKSSIWSSARLSGIAFAVDPNVTDASIDEGGVFNNAIFDDPATRKDEADYPGFKTIDVCYTDGNTCGGGRGEGNNGGLSLGEMGTFYTTLSFDRNISELRIKMDQFAIRWQSLTSKGDSGIGYGYTDASGVGTGQVPTPALIPSILGAGIAAFRKKRQEKKLQEQA